MRRCCWRAISTAAAYSPSCTALWSCWKPTSVPASGAHHQQVPGRCGDPAARPCHAGRKNAAARAGRSAVPAGGDRGRGLPLGSSGSKKRRQAAGYRHPAPAACIQLHRLIPLEQHPLLGVRYVQRTRQLGAPDLVILPGTKTPWTTCAGCGKADWKRSVLRLSAAGTPVLGVCGGYQSAG